jgi:hypothetical protein
MKSRALKWLMASLSLAMVLLGLWVVISISGYEMTFSRHEFEGVEIGMSRAVVAEKLRRSGVYEMESLPVRPIGSAATSSERIGGKWIRLEGGQDGRQLDQYDAWRYQVPNSYSTVDLRFEAERLVSIKYRWRPFEG